MEKLSHWYGSDVLDECRRLRKILEPICHKYHGPGDMIAATNTMYPFVLLLGNHSSGKSSFINYLLKRKVQMTGVAPTDDCFTIIGPSEEEDIDRNGPALIGDPDLGFHDLKTFGPILINHTQLKVRANTAMKDFMIVDSPGMIDSPVSRTTTTGGEDVMDRGYDFENVCRWYAERADLILLFFDPDKPGTTGETLSILTNALVGLDHKLSIVLNKADQFRRIHDFARAYGSLCWNLSKVIPRKDLPRIHTMCVPVQQKPTLSYSSSTTSITTGFENPNQQQPNNNGESVASVTTTPSERELPVSPAAALSRSFFDQGILDLEEGREEVIKEVYNVPRRRVDNEISRLFESVTALQMHCELMDHIVEKYQQKLWELRWANVGVTLASAAITYGVHALLHYWNGYDTVHSISATTGGTPTGATIGGGGGGGVNGVIGQLWHYMNHHWSASIVAGTGILTTFASTAVILYNNYDHACYLRTFQHRKTFEEIARKVVFAKALASKDAFTHDMVRLILDRVERNVQAEVLPNLSRVPATVFASLTRILTDDIANLRRRASPNFPTIPPIAINNTNATNTASTFTTSSIMNTITGFEKDLEEHIFLTSTPAENTSSNSPEPQEDNNETRAGQDEGKGEEGEGEEEKELRE